MPYTGLGLNHSTSTCRGPGRLAKRHTLNTSERRNQAPKKSANPTSIRYGVGFFSHFEKRTMNMLMPRSRPPTWPACRASVAPGRGQLDLATRVLRRVLRLDLRERHLEPAPLQDLVGPRTVDQLLRQLGHRQHLDLVQEGDGILHHVPHLVVDAVVHDIAHLAAAHDFRILAGHRHPEHFLAEAL